jgi:hypothetical protein
VVALFPPAFDTDEDDGQQACDREQISHALMVPRGYDNFVAN